mmetsp:Transcript_111536/g.228352  ORF Transcript_111536/g.228352 Transcript_111536/m.228352 type:complete len:93 (+) Transcript_111536:2493-2771(+)
MIGDRLFVRITPLLDDRFLPIGPPGPPEELLVEVLVNFECVGSTSRDFETFPTDPVLFMVDCIDAPLTVRIGIAVEREDISGFLSKFPAGLE